MIAYLNGRFLPVAQACVSILDRGFLYGDALFEGIRVYNRRLFLWQAHWERLLRGSKTTGIKVPLSQIELENACLELLDRNNCVNGLIRLTLSRGVGRRGYSPKGADSPNLAFTLHDVPPPVSGCRVIISKFQLEKPDPLANFKHCNKLKQVLARAEAEYAGANEALLTTPDGKVVEGASSNLFWIQEGKLHTPDLGEGILDGTTRGFVIDLAKKCGLPVIVSSPTPAQLTAAEGSFITSCAIEIVELTHLDGKKLNRSGITAQLQEAYSTTVAKGLFP